MSKCCFDPFKIHTKKVIALICVITKVYLQRQSNVSLENKTGRRIKVLKSCDTTYEVDSAVRIRL